jgi:rhamnosyltransferase
MPGDRSTPSVAVCLAAFNGEHWLDEQLDSILQQTGVSVRIFVSVDRSTDGTLALARKRAAMDDRIEVLPYGQQFGGAVSNFFHLLRTVDFSDYDYVSLSDQDDIWLPDKLLRAHQEMERTGADAYSSDVLVFWPSGAKTPSVKSQPQRKWDFLFEAAGAGCTYVMRTSLGRAVQKFLRANSAEVGRVRHHDWFFYAYARANGFRWHIDPRPGMLYRQHGQNELGVNANVGSLMKRARRVLDEGAFAQAALTARLCGLAEDPFVQRWSAGGRQGLLWLAFHAGECRRRPRDRALFAGACVASSVLGRRTQPT